MWTNGELSTLPTRVFKYPHPINERNRFRFRKGAETLIPRFGRISLCLLLAGLFVLPADAAASSQSTRLQKARRLYQVAVDKRARLEKKLRLRRTKTDYRRVIYAFDLVRHTDPTYGNVPPSLLAVADTYQAMGDRFSSPAYYRAAIKKLEFLSREYPYSRSSKRAKFWIGEIYRTKLKDSTAARNVFQAFLRRHPRSPDAPQARKRLREMAAQERREAGSQRAQRSGTGKKPVRVTDIRHWEGTNYTRIVIGMEGEVKYRSARLENPDRIFFDLYNASPSEDLKGKTLAVNGGFLKKIRVGRPQANITRVVLDVAGIEDYTMFSLPNPFRLIVDIRGDIRGKRPDGGGESDVGSAQRSEKIAANTARTKTAQTSQSADPSVKKEPLRASASSVARKSEPKKLSSKPATLTAAKAARPTASGSRTLTRALGLKIGRIVIDPGHGGHDHGTVGPSGYSEKQLVLDVALRLKKLIETKLGSEVILTRETDEFIPLEERAMVANEKGADLFISLHANASRHRWVRGIETYYLNLTNSSEALAVAARENAQSQVSVHELQDMVEKIALSEKVQESREFAREIQSSMYNKLRKVSWQKNRGVRKAPFVVLIGAEMPAVLAELSFLTNPKDERLLKQAQHRRHIAHALFAGIERYVKNLGGVKLARR